jgi:hypothetical protein
VLSVTLPLTVIVPGEAPGLRMPLTETLPLTVPAEPKVAPLPTAMVAALITDPPSPTRRPPASVAEPSVAVPDTEAKPPLCVRLAMLLIEEKAWVPPVTASVLVPARH